MGLSLTSEKSATLVGNKIPDFIAGMGKRGEFRQKHGFVPTLIMFSPTNWCNLNCIKCYPESSKEESKILQYSTIDQAIQEGKEKWAMPYFSISGGEPIDHAIDIAERHPQELFQVYTNGTLITNEKAEKIAQLGNLFPLISTEGTKEETDRIRGRGVYDKITSAMDTLTEHSVVWGVSFTLTSRNADVYETNFLYDIIDRGAMLGRFLTYMPTGRNSDFSKVPSKEQRKKQGEALRALEKEKRFFLPIDYLNNPGLVEGCGAAGLRYVNIDPAGDVYPCVFIDKPAQYNLTKAYEGEYLEVNNLEDILVKDTVMNLTRSVARKRDSSECCLVIDKPEELKEAYGMHSVEQWE